MREEFLRRASIGRAARGRRGGICVGGDEGVGARPFTAELDITWAVAVCARAQRDVRVCVRVPCNTYV